MPTSPPRCHGTDTKPEDPQTNESTSGMRREVGVQDAGAPLVRRDFMRLTEGSSDRRPGIRLLIVIRLSSDLSCDLSFHQTNELLDMSSKGEMEELGMLT